MSYTLRLELHKVGSPSDHSWSLLLELTDEEAEIVEKSDITREVTAALWRKQIDGAKEHGHIMQSGDKVDAIQNAFEEVLDLAQYLMKELQERGHE